MSGEDTSTLHVLIEFEVFTLKNGGDSKTKGERARDISAKGTKGERTRGLML